MQLTPIDIHHTAFKTSFRGYRKSEVDAFLRAALETVENLVKEKVEIERRAEILQQDVERLRSVESTMSSALVLAQQGADEIRANAHREAKLILTEAEQERVRMTIDSQRDLEKCKAEIGLLKEERARFESDFRRMLMDYVAWIDSHKPESEASVAQAAAVQPAAVPEQEKPAPPAEAQDAAETVREAQVSAEEKPESDVDFSSFAPPEDSDSKPPAQVSVA